MFTLEELTTNNKRLEELTEKIIQGMKQVKYKEKRLEYHKQKYKFDDRYYDYKYQRDEKEHIDFLNCA